MTGQPWHYENFDHQDRLGREIFGADWEFLEKLADVKKLGGMHIRVNAQVRRGHPRAVKYPHMDSFTGSYDVMQMHPQDFAWLMVGGNHWEYAHALSMKAVEWLINRSAERAIARINRPTETEWDQYMEDEYGEGWKDAEEAA